MPTFLSSFQIGAVIVPFRALISGYNEEIGTGITFQVPVLVENLTRWGEFASLRTLQYRTTVIPLSPGTVIVDAVAGGGPGTLTIDSLGTWTALLSNLRRTGVLPSGYVQGMAVFFASD